MTVLTIWKSILEPVGLQEIDVPMGSEFLCTHTQNEMLCVWYKCDPTAPKEQRRVAIVGTGHSAETEGADYLGSCLLMGGRLVLHVFVWAAFKH